MANYATELDLNNPTGFDTFQFAKKDNLANLKSEADKLNNNKLEKLDIDTLIPFPTGLSKLSNAVKNNLLKRLNVMLRLKILKIKYPVIPLNATINEVKDEIPSITNLATIDAPTYVANEIPDHNKYINTPKFYKLSVKNFAARLKQENSSTKTDITNFVKNTDFYDKSKYLNTKVTSNKTKHVAVENEFK